MKTPYFAILIFLALLYVASKQEETTRYYFGVTLLFVSFMAIFYITPHYNRAKALGRAIELLDAIFTKAEVCRSHGIDHAIWVYTMAANALSGNSFALQDYEYTAILLAALLHDSDDYKFFKQNKHNENARSILAQLYKEGLIKDVAIQKLVIEMIGYVSTSVNKDIIPSRARIYPWLLIPRYADRCAALGRMGIVRCFRYTLTKSNPLFTEATPRATTLEELNQIATPERYQAYKDDSLSMIDHFYDKLLHIGKVNTGIVFFNIEYAKRHQEMVDFVIKFGKTGKVDIEELLEWERLEFPAIQNEIKVPITKRETGDLADSKQCDIEEKKR